MAIVTKNLWIKKAFSFLIIHGYNSLSVKKIGQELGVSRGSFYHHFSSIADFHEAILKMWYNKSTVENIEEKVNLLGNTKIEKLRYFAWSIDHELDVAIRAWALHNTLAKHFQEKVDRGRLAYLEDIYRESYGTSKNEARISIAARTAYFCFIGVQSLHPLLEYEQTLEFKNELQQIIESFL